MKKKLVEAIMGELNLTEQTSTGGNNKNNAATSLPVWVPLSYGLGTGGRNTKNGT